MDAQELHDECLEAIFKSIPEPDEDIELPADDIDGVILFWLHPINPYSAILWDSGYSTYLSDEAKLLFANYKKPIPPVDTLVNLNTGKFSCLQLTVESYTPTRKWFGKPVYSLVEANALLEKAQQDEPDYDWIVTSTVDKAVSLIKRNGENNA